MAKVDFHNLGKVGVIKDIPPHQLPPEVWTRLENIRCQDGNLLKFSGHSEVMGTPSDPPGYLLNIPTSSASIWVYTSLEGIFSYDNGSHTDLSPVGGYNATEYEQWNGTILGGIPILNNGIDPPQMWPSLSSGSPFEDLDNWPADTTCKIIRAFGPFLIALNITDTNGSYPHMFWWSHPAEVGDVPVTWDYTDTDFQAGRRELTDLDAGIILDGMMLKDTFIIYKQFATHIVRFQGGQNVMKNDLLFSTSGILSARCVCPIDKGSRHFVVTMDDVIVHNGQSADSVVDDKNREYLFRSLSLENRAKAFCVHNPAKMEAWFCYPELGSEVPNKALVYNYKDQTTTFRDFVGNYATPGFVQETTAEEWGELLNTWDASTNTWGAEGKRQLVACSAGDEKFYQLDNTNSFNGSPIPFVIERTGLAVYGKDRAGQPKVSLTARKLVNRMWPKIQSSVPVTIEVGVQEFLNAPLMWGPSQSFDPNTQMYLDFVVNGRILAVRFSGNHSADFSLEGYDLELELLGEL